MVPKRQYLLMIPRSRMPLSQIPRRHRWFRKTALHLRGLKQGNRCKNLKRQDTNATKLFNTIPLKSKPGKTFVDLR